MRVVHPVLVSLALLGPGLARAEEAPAAAAAEAAPPAVEPPRTLRLWLFAQDSALVDGRRTLVAFEAPEPVSGVVLDERDGSELGRFTSDEAGHGAFDLTPRTGARYAVRLSHPPGAAATLSFAGADGAPQRDFAGAAEPARQRREPASLGDTDGSGLRVLQVVATLISVLLIVPGLLVLGAVLLGGGAERGVGSLGEGLGSRPRMDAPRPGGGVGLRF